MMDDLIKSAEHISDKTGREAVDVKAQMSSLFNLPIRRWYLLTTSFFCLYIVKPADKDQSLLTLSHSRW